MFLKRDSVAKRPSRKKETNWFCGDISKRVLLETIIFGFRGQQGVAGMSTADECSLHSGVWVVPLRA